MYEDWMPDLVIVVHGPLQTFMNGAIESCINPMIRAFKSMVQMTRKHRRTTPRQMEVHFQYNLDLIEQGSVLFRRGTTKKFKHWIFSDNDKIFGCVAFNRESRKSNKNQPTIDFFHCVVHDFQGFILRAWWENGLHPFGHSCRHCFFTMRQFFDREHFI
jgi:hypothetical protein